MLFVLRKTDNGISKRVSRKDKVVNKGAFNFIPYCINCNKIKYTFNNNDTYNTINDTFNFNNLKFYVNNSTINNTVNTNNKVINDHNCNNNNNNSSSNNINNDTDNINKTVIIDHNKHNNDNANYNDNTNNSDNLIYTFKNKYTPNNNHVFTNDNNIHHTFPQIFIYSWEENFSIYRCNTHNIHFNNNNNSSINLHQNINDTDSKNSYSNHTYHGYDDSKHENIISDFINKCFSIDSFVETEHNRKVHTTYFHWDVTKHLTTIKSTFKIIFNRIFDKDTIDSIINRFVLNSR
ncbi:hypothetical protein PoB_002757800 [Plakobranchus ocellatus]|uniref:Uncharacterized protein n=1 Tax=Plakobranchus ocellatus TaxID=259542 RepID=A0AAV4A1Q0_9GAST|nr:hypothetical protein PoB_002757800 [Plakobranchus ocellatus]